MSDDQKMKLVLTVLNEARKKARSESMLALTTAEVKMKVKRIEGCEGFTENDALTALDYMDGNQVKKVTTKHKVGLTEEARRYARRMGTPTSVSVVRWKIAQKGVIMLEGENRFSKKSQPSQVTVNATNSQVIIGNNNILSGKIEVVNKLTELQQTLSESDDLSLEQKQDVVADIESIKYQLGKPNPALDVIRALWSPVVVAADAAGAIGLATTIAQMLGLS